MVFGLIKFIFGWLIYVFSGEARPNTFLAEAVRDAPDAPEGRQPRVSAPVVQLQTEQTPAPEFSSGRPQSEGVGSSLVSTYAKEINSTPKPLMEKTLTEPMEMKLRLERLLVDLQTRELQNLGIGMILTVIGVVILLILVSYGSSHDWTDKFEFLAWFLPKISVAFIQIFAYFFLRQYRTNLSDIKYFNNELTNIEYKTMAAQMTLHAQGRKVDRLTSRVCLELLKVERNFILKKGETTVNLKQLEIDQPDEKKLKLDMMDTIKNLAKRLK
jgi:hypothetical protein